MRGTCRAVEGAERGGCIVGRHVRIKRFNYGNFFWFSSGRKDYRAIERMHRENYCHDTYHDEKGNYEECGAHGRGARRCFCVCPREESNLYYKIRNLASYPLNDEGRSSLCNAILLIGQVCEVLVLRIQAVARVRRRRSLRALFL